MDLAKALDYVSTGRSNGEGTGVLGVFWSHSVYIGHTHYTELRGDDHEDERTNTWAASTSSELSLGICDSW